MPTPTKGPRLGGGPAHERLILANLATSLFEHDSITTTEAKAKRLRPLAERLVTFAKRGDLHARRRVMTVIRDKGVVHRLFVEIAPGHGRAQRRLHPHHEDRRPQGRQRPHGGHRARPRARRQEGHRQGGRGRHQACGQGRRGQAQAAKQEEAKAGRRRDQGRRGRGEGRPTPRSTTAVELPAGAVAATEDGAAPEGYTVKGNADSGKYHVEGSQWYDQTIAEFWFKDAEAAEAAGFEPAGGEPKQQVEDEA